MKSNPAPPFKAPRPNISVSNRGIFLDGGKKITREAAIKIYLKQGSDWSKEAYEMISQFMLTKSDD